MKLREITLIAAVLATFTVMAQKNLVADGEFELGSEALNGSFSKQQPFIWYGATKDIHPGDGFQVVKNDMGYKQRLLQASFSEVINRNTYLSQRITGVETNQNYLIGFWLKTDNAKAAMRVELKCHNWENGRIVENKKTLGSLNIDPAKNPTVAGSWRYYTIAISTADMDEELLNSKAVRLLFFFNQTFSNGKPKFFNPENGQAINYFITGVTFLKTPLLISNGDFQRWDDSEEPALLTNWEVDAGEMTQSTGWKGSDTSVKFSASGTDAKLISDPLKGAPKERYLVSFWARSDEKTAVELACGESKKVYKLGKQWTRYTLSVSNPTKARCALTYMLSEDSSCYIDQITIE